MLLGMPHCGTTMDNDVARDFDYDITIDNYIAINVFCYVLQHEIMILLFYE